MTSQHLSVQRALLLQLLPVLHLFAPFAAAAKPGPPGNSVAFSTLQGFYCQGTVTKAPGSPTVHSGGFNAWKKITTGNSLAGGPPCDCVGDNTRGVTCEGWHQEVNSNGIDIDYYVPCTTLNRQHVCCHTMAGIVYYQDPNNKGHTFGSSCSRYAPD